MIAGRVGGMTVWLLLGCLLAFSVSETGSRTLSNSTASTPSTQNSIPTSPAKTEATLTSPSTAVSFVKPSVPGISGLPLVEEIVCQSMEINNDVERFSVLENCTVIEGYLKIVLIDYPNKTYDDLHFPGLREVTEYLLIYRVRGLKTLRNIFPNLAVIRGKTLARNYALVIFDNPDLEEIGLIGLTHITRGAVYIWKNNLLCYVDTISWNRITHKDFGPINSIKENKAEDQCANQCPSANSNNKCPTFYHLRMRDMCWTETDCQKEPQAKCDLNSTQRRGSCCHDFCLSGCYGPSRYECLICQEMHYMEDGACMQSCPQYSYLLHGRRCVSEEFCRNFTGLGPEHWPVNWKAHNGICTAVCPAKFKVNPLDPHSCVACSGPCPKVCNGKDIDTLAGAEELTHCTIINGHLEIKIGSGDQIVQALESALKNIEEVTDYVKIIRSHALLSLGFFKQLRLIGGRNLPSDGYALNIIDNKNLQDLFEFTPERPSLQIGRAEGKIGFHFNPLLCPGKIDTFLRKINASKGMKDYDKQDISDTSNGDRAACHMTTLKLYLLPNQTGPSFAGLSWDAFILSDSRLLLGYVLLYRPAPFRNLSKFEGRDACSSNAWSQVDVSPMQEGGTSVGHIIYNLRSAQQYAAYVTTYTVASEKSGAQSDIIYFSTLSSQPTKPVAVRTESINSSAIAVHWRKPFDSNGVIAYYHVRWQKMKDQHKHLSVRNYCNNPIQMPRQYFLEDHSTTTPSPALGCACNGTSTEAPGKATVSASLREAQSEYEEAIEIENFIQDTIYHTRRRDRRAVLQASSTFSPLTTTFVDGATVATSTWILPVGNSSSATKVRPANITAATLTTASPPPPEKIYGKKVLGTSFDISGLDHFTDYIISVEACHEAFPESTYKLCSGEATASATQTLAKRGADDIPSDSVQLKFVGQKPGIYEEPVVAIQWRDPSQPNGVIVRVDIELRNLDRRNDTEEAVCVARTLKSHQQPSHKLALTNMHPGNYSFRLRASSFAGNGSWTEERYLYVDQPLMRAIGGYSDSQMAAIVCGVFLPFLLLTAVACFYYKPWVKKIPGEALIVTVNPDYYSYTPDEWEVPREKIQLLQELGNGSFGKVYLGIGTNIEPDKEISRVAVKTVNEDKSKSERSFFLQEASIMKAFRCHHVVKLIGVVSEGQPALVIMELMELGDLKSYLRHQRPDEEHPDRQPPLLSRIIQMAGEISDGMAYIHSRKYVHRDLAARNCMINAELTVKIGDFGMTRDVYETDYYRKGGKGLLPVRWMAPESLKDGLFTNESDIWSFGVVLWEIATLAEQPYKGLSNEEVLRFVIDRRQGQVQGGVMERPEGCNDFLYSLMERCWRYRPRDRPNFLQIIDELLPQLSQTFRQKSYFSTVDLTDTLANDSKHAGQEELAKGQELQEIGGKVVSLLVQPERTNDDNENEESHETDQLLNQLDAADLAVADAGTPLEPTVVIQQNGGGGSPISSADDSRAMAVTFQPYPSSDNSLNYAKTNGSAGSNGGLAQRSPRSMY